MIMKYFEQDPEDNTFNLLMVDLTHRCNMECANCYLPNREIPDMDVDKLYEFLNKLPKRVIVRLIGAEPTTGSTKDKTSSATGCLKILYAAVALAVVIKEKAVLVFGFPLLTEIVSVPIVPPTVPFGEKPASVSVKAAY